MVKTRPTLAYLAYAVAVLAGLTFAAAPASAKKKSKPAEPVVEENAEDMVFAKSFIASRDCDACGFGAFHSLLHRLAHRSTHS